MQLKKFLFQRNSSFRKIKLVTEKYKLQFNGQMNWQSYNLQNCTWIWYFMNWRLKFRQITLKGQHSNLKNKMGL